MQQARQNQDSVFHDCVTLLTPIPGHAARCHADEAGLLPCLFSLGSTLDGDQARCEVQIQLVRPC